MPAMLAAYTDLTGRMQLPPIWALGYHQCRWFQLHQDAVEALGATASRRRLPVRRAVARHRLHGRLPRLHLGHRGLPGRPGHARALREKGFRVITIVDPGVKYEPGYWVFDQAFERDLFCRTEGGDVYVGQVWPGDTAFPDFVTEEARAWWGELNAAHVQSGLAGIWNDMNEPATGVIPPKTMRFGRGALPHERYHNQYALLMAMGTTDGLLAAMPERRTFILSRAGFAGIQRYAANWMGDNQSRWDHLWLSIADGDAASASRGSPSSGPTSAASRATPNAELFLRWMQYGALTPFCRNHSEIGQRRPVRLGLGRGGP